MDEQAVHDRRWWALAVMCLSLLTISLDNTILNIAIPALVNNLNASTSQLQWILDGYILVFAGLLLTTGSLGDRFGRRGALSAGLAIFCSGSLLSAFAGSATQLIFTRALMGVGAALIMPATLSLLTNIFSDPGSGVGPSACGPRWRGAPGRSDRCSAAFSSATSGGGRCSSSMFRCASWRSSPAASFCRCPVIRRAAP